MEAPGITRYRRPFLLPVWLTFGTAAAAAVAVLLAVFIAYRLATITVVAVIGVPPSAATEPAAQRIAQMFGPGGSGPGRLDAIYVSEDSGVRELTAPLARRLEEQPVVVADPDAERTARRLLHEHRGGRVLFVTRADALPSLLHELAGVRTDSIDGGATNALFIVSVPPFGHASIMHLSY